MNRQQVISELKQKLADMTDMSLDEICEKTRLYHDAQLSGDDYREFMVWYSRRFRVNLKGLNLTEFAPPEATNFLWPFERSKYVELDLDHLGQLSEYNSWEESGMSRLLPVS